MAHTYMKPLFQADHYSFWVSGGIGVSSILE
jgi:hypothetical protein